MTERLSSKTGQRRRGTRYWAAAGLPDNSLAIDQDVLLGRAKLCTDQRGNRKLPPSG